MYGEQVKTRDKDGHQWSVSYRVVLCINVKLCWCLMWCSNVCFQQFYVLFIWQCMYKTITLLYNKKRLRMEMIPLKRSDAGIIPPLKRFKSEMESSDVAFCTNNTAHWENNFPNWLSTLKCYVAVFFPFTALLSELLGYFNSYRSSSQRAVRFRLLNNTPSRYSSDVLWRFVTLIRCYLLAVGFKGWP